MLKPRVPSGSDYDMRSWSSAEGGEWNVTVSSGLDEEVNDRVGSRLSDKGVED